MSPDRFIKNLSYFGYEIKDLTSSSNCAFSLFLLKAWQDDPTHCAGTNFRWKNIPIYCDTPKEPVWYVDSGAGFEKKKILGSWNVQHSETKPNCLMPASIIQNSRFSSIYSFLWRQHTCALNLSGPCFSIWLYWKNTDQAPALRLPQHNRLLPSHATMSCKIPPSRLSVGFSWHSNKLLSCVKINMYTYHIMGSYMTWIAITQWNYIWP